jgi:hypothetical protein
MTESAPTAKSYRDYAVTLREVANDVASHENRAYLRSFADNYDNIAATIENAATETVLLHCRRTGTLMDEIDTWRTAGSLMAQHGAEADVAVAQYAHALFTKNDHLGAAIWIRVGRAIAELQRQTPRQGESMN